MYFGHPSHWVAMRTGSCVYLLAVLVANLGLSALAATLHPDIVVVLNVTGYSIGDQPRNSWKDSYSHQGRCYCDSNWDNAIADYYVETPDRGWMTVSQVCQVVGPGPGWKKGDPRYNDVQCGHGPANAALDERTCPGRIDIGNVGCGQIGPKWYFPPVTPAP